MSGLLRRHAGNLVVLALLGVWFVTLAPTAFGGPAAYIEVQGHSMDGTYATGDLVITREQATYAPGDVVAFRVGGGQVIHRITGGDGRFGYTLQGDNNPDPDPWHPTDADVVGAAWVHLPGQAHLLRLPGEPWFAGLAAGLVTLVVLGWDARPRRTRRADEAAGAESPQDESPQQESPQHESPRHEDPQPGSPGAERPGQPGAVVDLTDVVVDLAGKAPQVRR